VAKRLISFVFLNVAAMADHGDDEAPEETPGYQPPAPKSMEEILKSDADDESLRKYKESLLGAGNTVGLEVCKSLSWFWYYLFGVK